MWFVLDYNTETTLAMCHFKDVAYMIAEQLPIKCIVRYAENIKNIYNQDSDFFTEAIEEKIGA